MKTGNWNIEGERKGTSLDIGQIIACEPSY